jgi:hypothetical protein
MTVCFHLSDYVINTGGMEKAAMAKLIQNSEAMQICRDICNRTKHHSISKNPGDPDWSLGREFSPYRNGKPGYRHFLIHGTNKRDPLAVIKECELFWSELIAREMFSEPPNPFVSA